MQNVNTFNHKLIHDNLQQTVLKLVMQFFACRQDTLPDNDRRQQGLDARHLLQVMSERLIFDDKFVLF